ncbi:centriole, cilia and spindle-associated protein [Puntigrus tetrazona]|uniref:centriole, cilia and spindle-associated protein n=1 Tax=Puntigrus tetrazona TaxID=1606681 RepID=UPI001C8A4207|nr:centriole, cilia and spindle-associated protein [Puntigrus tetrazona]
MSANNNLMSKKIRTEYMKKFRDPKWETFSKCYEDSVKYRLTRRLMEQTHRPLFGDGWDSGSDSSGRSSPKQKEGNVSNAKHYTSSSESKNDNAEDSWKPRVNGEVHTDTSATVESSLPLENGCKDAAPNGPSESNPKRRQRRRAPRSEPCYPNKQLDSDESQLSVSRKPSRAKSQPPGNTKERASNRENRRSFIRYDWAERHIETRDRRTPNMRASMSAGEIHQADVGVQTRREAKKGGRLSEHRRARSADLEKCRRSALSVADERWMTEYMRCFSARLR